MEACSVPLYLPTQYGKYILPTSHRSSVNELIMIMMTCIFHELHTVSSALKPNAEVAKHPYILISSAVSL